MPQALGPLVAGALLGPAAVGTVGGLIASTAVTLGIGIGLSYIPSNGGKR